MKSRTKRLIAGATVAVGMLAMTGAANATYHENLIREVHYGTGVSGDFVVLQAYAAGQNLVSGKHIVTYDGGGSPYSSFTIPANVGNSANQATILIGDGGVTGADFTATPGFGNDGTHLGIVNNGSVCFTDSSLTAGLDCVSFGLVPLAALPSPAGTPLGGGGGSLANGQSILRTITRGCATALDPADDTNNSSADFASGPLFGRNNAATPTEVPCTTTAAKKKKCKKKKKHHGAYSAKKKKCKKKKKH